MAKVNTLNKYMVGVRAGGVVIMNPPREPMSRADAVMLAAWIVILSGDNESKDFNEALLALSS